MFIGPKVIFSYPEQISEETQTILEKLLDLAENGFFEHHNKANEELACGNCTFTIKSPWARGSCERLMISVVAEEGTHVSRYQQILETTIKKCQSIPELYKGLYLNSSHEDPQIESMNEKWHELIVECYQMCESALDNQKPGRMVFFGRQKVGKTSIIQRVTKDIFDPNVRPTLGTQMIKAAVESFQFIIYDLSGQSKYRQKWFEKPFNPNAIIFVLDCSETTEQQNETKQEFRTNNGTLFWGKCD